MTRPSLGKGALFTVLAMAAVAVMAALVKWMSPTFSTAVLMCARWGVGLAVFLGVYVARGRRVPLATRRLALHSVAALGWTGAIFSFYLSLRWVPLLDATLLLNTASLFAPILSIVLGRKREPPQVWLGILIGFAGVAVVLNPGRAMFHPMSFVALASGLLMAVRVYANARLGVTEPKERTTFYSLTVGFVLCVAAFLLSGAHVFQWEGYRFARTAVEPAPWPLYGAAMLVLGFLSVVQALFTAWGLERASVGQVAPFRYAAVLFAVVLDWVFWGQPPTASGLSGLALILLGAAVSSVHPRARRSAVASR